jgi:UDP-N-acetylmuramoylalanine--D-glutamate ligase
LGEQGAVAEQADLHGEAAVRHGAGQRHADLKEGRRQHRHGAAALGEQAGALAQPHQRLAERLVALAGAAAERIAAALAAAEVPVRTVTRLAEAVEAAASVAASGDTVVLAPACSSFDMFADYAARGRAFRAAVEGLG